VASRGRGIGAMIGFSFCAHAAIFPRGGREREEGAAEESEQPPSLYFIGLRTPLYSYEICRTSR